MLSSILGTLVKDVAEGKYGEGVKTFYWKLAGKKTIIALGIAALYAMGLAAVSVLTQCVPECGSAEAVAQLSTYVGYLPTLVAILIPLGLFDAAVRLDPPKKPVK